MFMTIKHEYAFDDDEYFENYEHDEYEHEDDGDEYDKSYQCLSSFLNVDINTCFYPGQVSIFRSWEEDRGWRG